MSFQRWRMHRFVLAVLLAVGASILAACGDGDGQEGRELPPTTASQLKATLDEVEQTVASGDCNSAAEQAGTLTQQMRSLPAGVDTDLRAALQSGASRLQSLVERECEQAAPTTEVPPAEPAPQEQPEDKEKDEQKPKKPKKTEPQDEQQDGEEQQPQEPQPGEEEGGAGGGGQEDGGSPTGGVTP